MDSSTIRVTIVKPIVKTSPSRIFLTISLIVINFCVRSVSGVDQNTSFVLDSWVSDNEGKYNEIISSCSDKCLNEDKYYGNLQGIGCQPYKDLCSKGCNQWNLSTFSTCKQVCHNNTWQQHVSPCDMACISGCNTIVETIMNTLRQHADFKTSPVLVEGTINGTTLVLSWPIVQKKFSTERLLLQYSYAESSSKWRFSSNFKWLNNHTCLIEKLQPHTKYRFRIAVMVTTDHSNFLYSAETDTILTLPEGVPSSAPEITNVFPLDHETIAVFWKPGRFINGPLQGYKIIAKISDANDSTTIEVKPISEHPIYSRKVRSDDQGSVDVNINHDDKSGTSGSVNVNKEVWSGSDGKSSVDVHAGASTNFDHGGSNVNAGVGFHW